MSQQNTGTSQFLSHTNQFLSHLAVVIIIWAEVRDDVVGGRVGALKESLEVNKEQLAQSDWAN